MHLGQSCKCMKGYGAKRAYCGRWESESFNWCYLAGGPLASSCSGAQKSSITSSPSGTLYWTQHADVCKGKIFYVRKIL